MHGTTVPKCCEAPEALVVMTAVPVCGLHPPNNQNEQAYSPPECDCTLPLRCAAVMDCWEATALLEAVGDVVV